jgi:Leucine Rich repeat
MSKPLAESPQPRPLSVPILTQIAGMLWIEIGLYGVWTGLFLGFVIRAFGHARDDSSLPAQLFLISYLTVCFGVRTVRGRQRGVIVPVLVASFCGVLIAATDLDFRRPYQLIYEHSRWWLTTLLGAPIVPNQSESRAGLIFWLALIAITVAGIFALASRRAYLRYRRQRAPEAGPKRWRVAILTTLLPVAVLLFPVVLNVIAYSQARSQIRDERQDKLRELAAIPEPEKLRKLNLDFTGMTDADLSALKRFTALTELRLTGSSITDAGMKDLCDLPNLESLDIGFTAVSDEGLKELRRLERLRTLSLGGIGPVHPGRITDAGLKEIAQLKQLTSLSLCGDSTSGRGLCEIQRLTNLTELRLDFTRTTDATLGCLRKLKRLTILALEQTDITDAGLKSLAELKDLKQLDLRGTRVTDAGMKDIAKLTKLTHLNLYGTKITDLAVDDLLKLKALVDLSLVSTNITDKGLLRLVELKELRRLPASGEHTTPAGLLQFEKLRPDVKVRF